MNTVYALVDPLTKEARYIGITRNVGNRYSQHCTGATSKRIIRWRQSLEQKGLQIELAVLEEGIPESEASDAEVRWIKQYRSNGANLLNTRVGGKTSRMPKGEVVGIIVKAPRELHYQARLASINSGQTLQAFIIEAMEEKLLKGGK